MTSDWAPSGAFPGSATPPPVSAIQGAARMCPVCMGRYPADYRVCPRDASPLVDAPEDQDLLIGAVLGDTFHVIRLIGEGGMARVYEARHVRLTGKRFAVKVLLAAYAQNAEVVARFQREAQAASDIAHPNVVDVYDVYRTPDGTPYLVCEYLDGTDFASLLDRQRKIDAPTTVHIVRQLCAALGAAHARGIVHRDVKPENVFLVGDPAAPLVKVIDFGISKVEVAGGSNLTKTGMIMGTPAYMPPEQARGARADLRADVYGVGAILYRALTGKLPFDYEDAAEALSAVLTRDPPRPRSLEPSISPALELVIQRAMAKDPAERYATMDELAAELEPFGVEPTAEAVDPQQPGTATSGPTVNPVAATLLSSVPLTQGAVKTALTQRPRSTAVTERVARAAQWSRPKIVLYTVAATLWTALVTVDTLGALVLATKPAGGALTAAEVVLATVGVGALTLTPLVLWVRYVARNVWSNSVRALAVAERLAATLGASVLAYGITVLVLRLLTTIGLSPIAAASPLASLPLLGVAFAAAGLRLFVTRFEKG